MEDPRPVESQTPPAEAAAAVNNEETSKPFVGRWNHLVSTTNWEKGRIIFEWRDALKASGAPPADCSDEAWGRLVGCVTGQHVGRLRRVYQRFSRNHDRFEGLYWSHFQAAVDWDDAEMWLEGAVQNGWPVGKMRRQRWETLGAVAGEKPRDEDVVASELDEDFEPAGSATPATGTLTESYDQVQGPRPEGPDFGDEDEPTGTSPESAPEPAVEPAMETPAVAVRPFENLAELPEDVSEAFESMKLAVLHHKSDGWREIGRDEMLGCLDALKELALAPSADGASPS